MPDLSNLYAYRALSPDQRSFWVNWCLVNGPVHPDDIYTVWATGDVKRIPQTCYLNWTWATGEGTPYTRPDAPWTPNYPGGIPELTLYERVSYLPDLAQNTLLSADLWGYVLQERVRPRRSYDTGIARRRRNYAGP